MNSEKNQETSAESANGTGEVAIKDKIELTKSEYEELLETKASFGSLKREFKDLKKELETKDTPQKIKTDDLGLLQKSYLRAAGITAEDEVELALSTSKKWGVEVDKLVDDEDFKIKLEKLKTSKANADATSNIHGGQGASQAKNTPEYWIAKGTPPSATDVPDRKTRAKIARAMLASTKSSKTFYNE